MPDSEEERHERKDENKDSGAEGQKILAALRDAASAAYLSADIQIRPNDGTADRI